MVRRIKNAGEITDLNKSYIMEFPQDKVIKDIDEITDLNKSYIMEFPEEQKPIKPNKNRKKHDMRLSKITKKDILENSNKRKEKQNGFLPPDVAAMQADVEFIKQQIAQSARSKESHKYNKLNPFGSVNEKITNEKKTARGRENRKQFDFKNPLYPNKLEMIDFVFAQREARKLDKKNTQQSYINNLYNQMKRKNIDNNISRISTKTIKNQGAQQSQ